MSPQRIQRKRTKGWKMPPNCKYVGRPGPYANPFSVKVWGREGAVQMYRWGCEGNWQALKDHSRANCGFVLWSMPRIVRYFLCIRRNVHELRQYKYLCCWCPLTDANGNHVPCHVDVLIEMLRKEN